MKKIDNECACCGLPCLYDSCPHYKVERYYCDKCGDEEELYYFEDEELCINCIKERLEKVV